MTIVASNYARQENDLYQTEPWATRALLRNLHIPSNSIVWEPFAGTHMMSDVLCEGGRRVITSDIRNYNCGHTFLLDFLSNRRPPPQYRYHHIISNPPYGPRNNLAPVICRRALERCNGTIAMLLPAKFDFGRTRSDLFGDNPRYAMKIALVDRIQWFPPGEGTEDHAWYVWGPIFRRPLPPIIRYEGRTYHPSPRYSMLSLVGEILS